MITMPAPIRTFADPVTKVTVSQLTSGGEGAVSLYFTQPTWTADGRYFLFLRKQDRAINYFAVGPDGQERQLTHFPATPNQPKYLPWMHRKKLAEECERFSWLWPAIHPSRPMIVFPFQNVIYELNVETGACARIHEFTPQVSEQGFFAIYQNFTADGKHIIFSTAARGKAIDPPHLPNNSDLKDESTWEGRLWRFNYEAREMEAELFTSNGEQAHLLTCPWDPELIFWANYKHKCEYLMRRDGTGLRSWFMDDPRAHAGHYNWDTANRAMVTLISDPQDRWFTVTARIDLTSGAVRRFRSGQQAGGQFHPNASPDGRWIVMDIPNLPVGGTNGLHLLDTQADTLHPLCQLGCSWGYHDEDGGAVKSEWLHPNPVFSPDGRYVFFHNDFGSGVAQTYMADLSTWHPM